MEGGTVIQVSAPIFHSHRLPRPKILPLLVTLCKALLVARGNGNFRRDVGISLLCLMAVVSGCRVSSVDSLGRLDGDQQHQHHQQRVPDPSAPMWLCRGEAKHRVAACERDATAVLPPGEMLPGTSEAEAWALQGKHTKYSCSTTRLPFLLSTGYTNDSV